MIQKPLRIIPVIRATKETIVICDTYYPDIHHQNGPENAFRHALWNLLICKYVYKLTTEEQSAMFWAEKITTLHEKLSPNLPLEEAMDLQNNKMGRMYFLKLKNDSNDTILLFLKEEMANCKLIKDCSEIELYTENLVHIESSN